MKTKLLVPIIGGGFLLVSTILTVVFNGSSNQTSTTIVQIEPKINNGTHIEEVENLTINQ